MTKVIVLYRPNTDQDPIIREFTHNYEKQTGKKLELISLDTVEGSELAKIYGVVEYPAIIARDNEGKLLQIWQGTALPLMNEVSFYDQHDRM